MNATGRTQFRVSLENRTDGVVWETRYPASPPLNMAELSFSELTVENLQVKSLFISYNIVDKDGNILFYLASPMEFVSRQRYSWPVTLPEQGGIIEIKAYLSVYDQDKKANVPDRTTETTEVIRIWFGAKK